MLKHNDVILKIYESIADDYNVDIARFRKHDFISRLNELNFMLASALEEFQNYMLLHYDTDINDLVDINILMYRFDSFIRCGLYFNTN